MDDGMMRPGERAQGEVVAVTSLVRNKLGTRAASQSMHRLSRAELVRGAALYPDEGQHAARPKTRGECPDTASGPCPWVSCKYHLYLDVNERTGSIKFNFPHLEVWELTETCALDLADRGGMTLEATGEAISVTRERARQIETLAIRKAARSCTEEGAYIHDPERTPPPRREQPRVQIVPTAQWERVLYTMGWRRASSSSIKWDDPTGRRYDHHEAYAYAVASMRDEEVL